MIWSSRLTAIFRVVKMHMHSLRHFLQVVMFRSLLGFYSGFWIYLSAHHIVDILHTIIYAQCSTTFNGFGRFEQVANGMNSSGCAVFGRQITPRNIKNSE